MLYRLDAELPDLADACERVKQQLPAIADTSQAVGPLLRWTGLQPADYLALEADLPASDVEVVLADAIDSVTEARAQLFPLARGESFTVLFPSSAAIELAGGEPTSFRIRAPPGPATGRASATAARGEPLLALLRAAVLPQMLATPFLEPPSPNVARAFVDTASGARLIASGPDEVRVELLDRTSGDVGMILERLTAPPATLSRWRAALGGTAARARTRLATPRGWTQEVNVGASPVRHEAMLALEYETPDLWRKRLLPDALAPRQLERVLAAERKIAYREIVLRWTNLRAWIWNASGARSPQDPEPFSDNAIELSRGPGRVVREYFTIGDWLPRRQIREALERQLGASLKKLRW